MKGGISLRNLESEATSLKPGKFDILLDWESFASTDVLMFSFDICESFKTLKLFSLSHMKGSGRLQKSKHEFY